MKVGDKVRVIATGEIGIVQMVKDYGIILVGGFGHIYDKDELELHNPELDHII